MSLVANLLQQLTGGENLPQVSRAIGADEKTTANALSAALPMLMGALARNSSKPEGAEALHKALAKDHDGGILDNLAGFMGQSDQGPGAGILKHVLGARQGAVQDGISKSTGLDTDSAGKLLAMVAPMIMGALGRSQRQQNLSAGSLAGLLGDERKTVEKQAAPQLGMLNAILDADGDGDVDMSDMAKKGMGFLGKMLGGKN